MYIYSFQVFFSFTLKFLFSRSFVFENLYTFYLTGVTFTLLYYLRKRTRAARVCSRFITETYRVFIDVIERARPSCFRRVLRRDGNSQKH